ncbi:hypothetical protein F52700_6295 [Fusarium sp. NRRL 52700]|nr:hypothetical protein F52700_6295 [Fusarium sp. NRRL 52700]
MQVINGQPEDPGAGVPLQQNELPSNNASRPDPQPNNPQPDNPQPEEPHPEEPQPVEHHPEEHQPEEHQPEDPQPEDHQQGSEITSFPAFRANLDVENSSDNVSHQFTPQPDSPQQGSESGSHSTATGPFPPYNDPMQGNQKVGNPSVGVPQTNDPQINEAQNIPQSNNTHTSRVSVTHASHITEAGRVFGRAGKVRFGFS